MSQKPQLLCFHETLSSSLGAGSPIATSTLNLTDGGGSVIHLEAVSAGDRDRAGESNKKLLAIHQNGKVTCYDENLEKEIWSSGASTTIDRHVLLADITNVVQLKKGLLKHREDVLASFNAIEGEKHDNVLILLTRAGGPNRKRKSTTIALQIFKFNITSADPDGSTGKYRSRPQELVSINITEPDRQKMQDSTFKLDVASGTLFQQTPGFLTIYDLTGLLPKIAHGVTLGKEDVASFLSLSPFTLAVSRQSSFSLIGLPYCSMQAESSPDSLPSVDHGPLRLLSYFPQLNIMVAIKGRRLMTIQLPDFHSKSRASHKRKRGGVLVDSIGRGSYSTTQVQSIDGASGHSIKNLGTLLTSLEDIAWKSKKTKWDALFSNVGAEAFSNAIAYDLEMQDPEATIHVDQQKIPYLLNKLFTLERKDLAAGNRASNKMGLKVNYLDREAVFSWLLQKGLLTVDRVESSLRKAGFLQVSETLAPGALIDSLAKEDLSLGLLTSLLASQIPLSPQELAAALTIIIQQWDNTWSSQDPKQFTDNEPEPDPMQFKDDNHHRPSQKSLTISNTTASTSQLFHLTLTRLFLLPQSTITSALRSQLTKPHLLHLVDILRIEIARSGWLSPYDDNLTPPTASTAPNNQLAHITHLLNSTIDAIGAGSLILGSGFNDDMIETADTISYMKAEISAALEGIEEAVYLKGILGEVLLCGKEALGPSKIKDAAVLPNRNVPKTVVLQDEEPSALPLGLKLEKKVSMTRVGAGGELIGRSKRDIGRLKSKMVGKYSFERIVV